MDGGHTTGPLAFAAPGPGTWLLDGVHMPRPFSRFQQAIHPPGIAAGCRDCFGRYGLLVDYLDYRFVNGLGYFMPVPAPEPEIPARFAAADQAVAGRNLAGRPRALAGADQAGLDPGPSRPAVDRPPRARQPGVRRSPRSLHSPSAPNGPAASFAQRRGRPAARRLHGVRDGMDRPAARRLPRAPARCGAEFAGAFPELDRLVSRIRGSRTAQAVLASGKAPEAILAELRAEPGDVGRAASGYLDIVSYRLLDSLDTADVTAIEMPEVLLEGLRLAVDEGAPAAGKSSAQEREKLRDLIPDAHRGNYDELLGEARLMSRLRDERGLYSDVWAAGIARRALLIAGSRLADRHRLHEAAHLIEADPDELRALRSGTGGPDADELAERADDRAALRALDAPPFLGEPPHPPPSLDGLPPAVARLMRALGIAIDAIFAPSAAASDAGMVRGTGASPGRFTGVARVIDGPADFRRLQRGDILVTSTTTEAFNIVLPMLGALVTDTGGLLSHAAIVSREYGIPGVVGCLDATSRIADGARLTVDGGTGEVRIDPE